jgi:hypothetical protein
MRNREIKMKRNKNQMNQSSDKKAYSLPMMALVERFRGFALSCLRAFVPLCVLLITSCISLSAQRISNVHASFNKEKLEVIVSYYLESTAPRDLLLSYSIDNGRTWKQCISISGDIKNQTTGTKTLVWQSVLDVVALGKVLFKVSSNEVTVDGTPNNYNLGDFYSQNGITGIIYKLTSNGHGALISMQESNQSYYNAPAWCESLGSGWYCPTVNDLHEIYDGLHSVWDKANSNLQNNGGVLITVGGYGKGDYGSSDIDPRTASCGQCWSSIWFENNYISYVCLEWEIRIRAVRTF